MNICIFNTIFASETLSMALKYIYIHIYLYIYTYIRLTHPRSGDSQGQEKFLAPSADKQTCNYGTRVLKPPSLPINPKVKGIEPQQDEMVRQSYTNLPVDAIGRLPHPQSGDSQGQETFLVPSADKQCQLCHRVL